MRTVILLIPVLVLIGLAIPPYLKHRSPKKLAHSILVSSLGVMLPLFVYFLSSFMIPDWKGGCTYGWVDCFYLGKLTLTPIVLLATGALYAVELFEPGRLSDKGAALALFLGSLTAAVCFLFGLLYVAELKGAAIFLFVPLYIAVWHGVRAWKLRSAFGSDPLAWMLAFIGSIPLWVWSVLWSKQLYASLPSTAPDCFVVTAASHGHASFVGPFIKVAHKGNRRRANLQLATLWQFESLWRNRSPHSHAMFRRAYNRVGPAVAKRINHPVLADMAYILIKPVELAARLILNLNRNQI